jgi:hypothetical protein
MSGFQAKKVRARREAESEAKAEDGEEAKVKGEET